MSKNESGIIYLSFVDILMIYCILFSGAPFYLFYFNFFSLGILMNFIYYVHPNPVQTIFTRYLRES